MGNLENGKFRNPKNGIQKMEFKKWNSKNGKKFISYNYII
jgi:hypothetical protein